jgi:glycosyltransferase involved in cell wall biosynthesis
MIKARANIDNIVSVIFYTPYPEESAVTRYRILQFFPYLSSRNIQCTYSSMMCKSLYKIKNKNGFWNIIKPLLLTWCLLSRLFELICVAKYDVVILHREFFPFFTPFFEKLLHRFNRATIFDFDDAIYCRPTYNKNWRDTLRNPENVSEICRICRYIIVGNEYLRQYAIQFNNHVVVIPTVFDFNGTAEVFERKENKIIVIGWIGSWHTVNSLNSISIALQKLSKEHQFILRIIGEKNIYNIEIEGVSIEYELGIWNPAAIASSINGFDIGIMPLIDSEWERGKCGFKLIQYMSLGVPAVASPIGVNKNILRDGVNGFLADNEDEWVIKLSMLLKSRELRQRIGAAGKMTAQEEYTAKKWAVKMENIIRTVHEINLSS